MDILFSKQLPFRTCLSDFWKCPVCAFFSFLFSFDDVFGDAFGVFLHIWCVCVCVCVCACNPLWGRRGVVPNDSVTHHVKNAMREFPNILIVQVFNCIFQEKDKISRTMHFVSEVARFRVKFWEKRGKGFCQDDRMFRQPRQPTGTVRYNFLMTSHLHCLGI